MVVEEERVEASEYRRNFDTHTGAETSTRSPTCASDRWGIESDGAGSVLPWAQVTDVHGKLKLMVAIQKNCPKDGLQSAYSQMSPFAGGRDTQVLDQFYSLLCTIKGTSTVN